MPAVVLAHRTRPAELGVPSADAGTRPAPAGVDVLLGPPGAGFCHR
jgi:hypothetical protein